MTMTPEEIMSYQGHEFTYVFIKGDTMPAYIKKIDLEKELMTYWSFSLVTDDGYEFDPLDEVEEAEGACCLGYEDNLPGIIDIITEIKTTGRLTNKYNQADYIFSEFEGCIL